MKRKVGNLPCETVRAPAHALTCLLNVLRSLGWRFLFSEEKVLFFGQKSCYKQDSQEERFVSLPLNGKRLSRLFNICQTWGDWLSLCKEVTGIDSFIRSKFKDCKDVYLHHTVRRPSVLGTHWAQLWRAAGVQTIACEHQRTIPAVWLYPCSPTTLSSPAKMP